jgi:hypothetical protein
VRSTFSFCLLGLVLLVGCATQRKVVDLGNLSPEAEPILTFQLPGKNSCETDCAQRFPKNSEPCQEFCRCVYGNVSVLNNPTLGDIMRCFQAWIDKLKA